MIPEFYIEFYRGFMVHRQLRVLTYGTTHNREQTLRIR